MTEKGFRELRCGNPACGKVLRIQVTPAMYGKTGIVTCKADDGGCGTKNRITIPTPAEPITPKKPSCESNGPFASPFGDDPFGDIFGDVFGKMK